MKTRLWFLLVVAVLQGINFCAAAPRVNVFASAASVTEGSAIQFNFRKEGPGVAVVPFTFAGTATEGPDFVTGGGEHSVLIPSELVELNLQVFTLRDSNTNENEVVVIRLGPDASYEMGDANSAGVRIQESFNFGPPNSPPAVYLTATEWADRIDLEVRAADQDGIARIWLFVDNKELTTFSNSNSFSQVTFTYTWTNAPAGRHEINAVALDRRGAAAGLSYTAPVVILIGNEFTFPKQGASSTDGVTLIGNLVTSVDTVERRRRLLLEFPIPASATNSEGYLRFRNGNTGRTGTNEIFAYTGDGLLSTNDLAVTGEAVTKFVSRIGGGEFRIDVTPFIRQHAGGFLGLWINDEPDPKRTSGFGDLVAQFFNFKLELLSDSVDEPAAATWLNAPASGSIPFFEPFTFLFQVIDNDSRVTALEVHSAENGLLARLEGTLLLGTNLVAVKWTNPIRGDHSLSLKIFNEDDAIVTTNLGTLRVERLNARMIVLDPPSAEGPRTVPFVIEALVVTPADGSFQAELSIVGGNVLQRKQVDLLAGTNRISLAWTNPAAGDYIFQVKLSDDAGNAAVGTSSSIKIIELDHVWLNSGDDIEAIHVVDAAGRIRAWGYNYDGDLGLGYAPKTSPHGIITPAMVAPPAGLKWKQIASSGPTMPGVHFAFGLASDGSLWGWGYNYGGVLGPMDSLRTASPIAIKAPAGVLWWRKVFATRESIGAIDQDGNLWQWAPNSSKAKTRLGVEEVRIHNTVFLTLSANGTLSSFGNFKFPIGVNCTREFEMGASHYLAIGSDGQLYAWGGNLHGELPFPTPAGAPIAQPTNAVRVAGATSWKLVAAAENLSLAVDNNGRLFSWGASTNTGARNPVKNEPALVDVPETGWLDVAVNNAFATALSERGNLYVWGTVFANTPSMRRVIRFPEKVEGLPELLDASSTASLATFDTLTLKAGPDFSLNVIAPAGGGLRVESSSDLVTWQLLTNLPNPSAGTRFVQPLKESGNVFYRVR